MKEFMLLVRNQIDHQATWPAERHEEFVRKCISYVGQITSEGRLISAQPLVRDGIMISRSEEDWKEVFFNETKGIIVGCYHILAENFDEAVAIAKRNPECEYGAEARIEVRPIQMKDETTDYVYPRDRRA
jgi:hypothetical protein